MNTRTRIILIGLASFASLLPILAYAAPAASTGVSFDNPAAQVSFCQLIKALLNIVIVLALPIMIGAFVYAGFRLAYARGNEIELKKAKNNLWFTLAGVILFLGAWTFAQLVGATINSLQRGAGNPGGVIVSC